MPREGTLFKEHHPRRVAQGGPLRKATVIRGPINMLNYLKATSRLSGVQQKALSYKFTTQYFVNLGHNIKSITLQIDPIFTKSSEINFGLYWYVLEHIKPTYMPFLKKIYLPLMLEEGYVKACKGLQKAYMNFAHSLRLFKTPPKLHIKTFNPDMNLFVKLGLLPFLKTWKLSSDRLLDIANMAPLDTSNLEVIQFLAPKNRNYIDCRGNSILSKNPDFSWCSQ